MSLDPEKCVSNTVEIAIGETKSTAIRIGHYDNIAILLPANWITGTITFEASATEDGTYLPVVYADDVGAVTIASVAHSQCICPSGEIYEALKPLAWIKLVAGAAQTTTAKVITIIMKR